MYVKQNKPVGEDSKRCTASHLPIYTPAEIIKICYQVVLYYVTDTP